jgi:hypothetical protein
LKKETFPKEERMEGSEGHACEDRKEGSKEGKKEATLRRTVDWGAHDSGTAFQPLMLTYINAEVLY